MNYRLGNSDAVKESLAQLYETLLFFIARGLSRVRLFARFLSLFDGLNQDDLDYYLEVVSLFEEGQLRVAGFSLIASSVEQILVPFESCKTRLYKREELAHHDMLKKAIERLEEGKTFHKQRGEFVVELEAFYECQLQLQKSLSFAFKNLHALFKLMDFDNNQKVEQDEFLLFFACVEREAGLFELKEAGQRFCKRSDKSNLAETGQKLMSY